MTHLDFTLEHQVRGRLRLKLSSAKRNPQLLAQIKQTFDALPGVKQVIVNPTTGSVVLQYDEFRHEQFLSEIERHLPAARRAPRDEFDELADQIDKEGERLDDPSYAARGLVDALKAFDWEVKGATANLVDLKIVLAAMVAGVGLLQLGAVAASPAWVALMFLGLNRAAELNPSVARASAGADAGSGDSTNPVAGR